MDRALTEAALLSALPDPRLPAEAAGGLAADLLLGLAIGLLAAALIGAAVRVARRPAVRPRPEPAGAEDRRLLLLHRLKRAHPERYAALTSGLYRPGGMPDEATLRRSLSR